MNQLRKTLCLFLVATSITGILSVPASADIVYTDMSAITVSDNRTFPASKESTITQNSTKEETGSQNDVVDRSVASPTEETPSKSLESEASKPTQPTDPPEKSSGSQTSSDNADTESTSSINNKVPLYFQDDYPNTPYGNGTVRSSGCGITSLAMVASYLTNRTILPDELAERFGSHSGSNMDRMEFAAKSLGFTFEKVFDWTSVIEGLVKEKVVIVLFGKESKFTNSQHFVVLTGLTADGKIMINDPYKPNYTTWPLKDGFINGFDVSEASCGFSGAWIFEDLSKVEQVSWFQKYGRITEKVVRSDPEVYEKYKALLEPYSDVPQYFQDDYPDAPCGDGTVSTHGNGLTALAMAVSYVTRCEILPDELAVRFGSFPGSNFTKMEYAVKSLALPYTKTYSWEDVEAALKQGSVAVVLRETIAQNFITLGGITDSGKIIVKDPFEPNHRVLDYSKKYLNGFDPSEVSNGFCAAWIFEPIPEIEQVVMCFKRTSSTEPPKAAPTPTILKIEISPTSRYKGLNLSWEDIQTLAALVHMEAGVESLDGQQAVAEVVLNRMADKDYFGSSLKGVVYAENQFSSAPKLKDAKITIQQYEAIDLALNGPSILPINVVYFGYKAHNDKVWGTIGKHTFCYHWWYDMNQ